jgi:hypothetical protein
MLTAICNSASCSGGCATHNKKARKAQPVDRIEARAFMRERGVPNNLIDSPDRYPTSKM